MIIEIPKGWNFGLAVDYAKDYARDHRMNYVNFEFNGVEVTVYSDSNINDICYIYQLELTLRRLNK